MCPIHHSPSPFTAVLSIATPLANHGDPEQAGYSIETQVQALGQKYLGSSRPESRADVMFNSQPPKSDGLHPVPVTNFMNAQCM